MPVTSTDTMSRLLLSVLVITFAAVHATSERHVPHDLVDKDVIGGLPAVGVNIEDIEDIENDLDDLMANNETTDSPSATTTTTTASPEQTDDPAADPGEEEMIGPDDLVLVDYIIIGVTCAVLGGVIIGGIAMTCVNKKKAKQAKRTKEAKQRMVQSQRAQWDNTAMQDDDIKPDRY